MKANETYTQMIQLNPIKLENSLKNIFNSVNVHFQVSFFFL